MQDEKHARVLGITGFVLSLIFGVALPALRETLPGNTIRAA